MVCYFIVETNTSYNILIKQKKLNRLGDIISTLHMEMKFLTEDHLAIITVKVDPQEARICYALSLKVAIYMPPTSLALSFHPGWHDELL